MRRSIAGMTLLVGLATLLVLPLASTGQPPNLAQELKSGVNKTLGGVNDVVARLREEERKRREREAAKRRAAAPRAATPGPQGTGYNPPLHGTNPHAQGTPATVDLPPSSQRPLPADPAGGNGEIVVAGRSRGEQNPNGTYHGHITIAALFGQEVVGVNTNPGQTEAGPLDPVQQNLLTPLCNATQQGICLTVLRADSATTGSGSTNRFEAVGAGVGGPTGINASAVSSNGNISQDANCQTAHGDSNVADASVGAFTADAIQSTSDSRECKDGTRTQNNTSRVVNLGTTAVTLPPLIPEGCGNGTPNTPALIPTLLPAVCNAAEVNAAQAAATYGVREGLTVFALDVGTSGLLKTTTSASESRAFMRAQCSDGVDNDGDGRIDFPADPDCTGPTDDSEAGTAGRDDDGGREGAERGGDAECEDGRDNDGDGLVDFPEDPGCTSRSDDSEAGGGGTAGAGRGGAGGGGGAECSDGVDNDGDGRVDFPDDPQCTSESDDSEADGAGGGRLAFTGTNLVLMFLVGSLVLLAGLRIRALTGRGNGSRAQRAGMA
jgi:hypothetical protein